MAPPSIEVADVQQFRAALTKRVGLVFDESKMPYLEELLQRHAAATGVRDFLALLTAGSGGARGAADPLPALISDITVGETYFFRHLDQLRAFTDVAVPTVLRTSNRRRLSILSAGCSTGEEPYSLAMLVREQALADVDVKIVGADINPASLAKAVHGRYSRWSLRETPREALAKFFREEGRDVVLDASIRAMVRFEERNLALDDDELWRPNSYDVVFCRNMLMYFEPERARELVARITRALTPDGFLFLGHAETLRGISSDYTLKHTHGTFYYARRTETAGPHAHDTPAAAQRVAPVEDASASTWVETIQRAATRIESLADAQLNSSPVAPSSSSSSERRSQSRELVGAVDLLKQERFTEALALLTRASEESMDSDALLLRAALLTHTADIDAAERACHALLAVDDLNAGAHYLLALCRENRGDSRGACDHDEIAAHLDTTFAMPRLHRGLLARRAGDKESARRELSGALLLLEREDPARILLFGGGFGREALVALCRAELAAAGGHG